MFVRIRESLTVGFKAEFSIIFDLNNQFQHTLLGFIVAYYFFIRQETFIQC